MDGFTSPRPITQKSHVVRIHTACAPTDAIEFLDQVGCKNSSVNIPPVSDVHEDAKLMDQNLAFSQAVIKGN